MRGSISNKPRSFDLAEVESELIGEFMMGHAAVV
jgi:hypothetical protein